jgi:hypothetical protein
MYWYIALAQLSCSVGICVPAKQVFEGIHSKGCPFRLTKVALVVHFQSFIDLF